MKQKNTLLVALTTVLFLALISCASRHNEKDIVADNFDFAAKQFNYAFQCIDDARANESEESRDKREKNGWSELTNPRTTEPDGTLLLVPSRDWTSGFFPGELWYMYEYTGEALWKEKAEKHTQLIECEKLNGRTHDMGFKMYCSYGNGYRLTNSEHYKETLIESAYTLITRYKANAGILRSWDHNTHKWQSPVIIDNMMNLELLFWAFNQTNDSLFYNVAVNHARTTLKNHFREDYSTYHVVDYDTITGNVIKKNTHQGLSDDSSWARGQAWAIYGYTMCYRETQLPEFLEQAKRVEHFLFTHPNMPADLIPYWDFDAPDIPDEPRDASAATCIASALYELSLYDAEQGDRYKRQADTILENLTAHYRATLNADNGFLLLHSTGSKPHDSEIDVPLVYADYYFLEALIRKQKIEETGTFF